MQKELRTRYDEVKKRILETGSAVPEHRTAFRKGYSFSTLPFDEQLATWHHIWKQTKDIRTRLHAFFFLERYMNKRELHGQLWDTSVSWQDDVDDWPLCDSLSKINTKILETFPAEVYRQLADWNQSDDLWKRRQSIVSLLYYSRTKKLFTSVGKITGLVTPLLTDKEYYVQKGVGWTLRELYNVYPKDTMAFLKQHIKDISAIAFTIAIEKMDEAQKNKLKRLRK